MTYLPMTGLAPALTRDRLRTLLPLLLTCLALAPYAVGWLAGAAAAAARWAWAGVVVGWRDGRNSIEKGGST